MVPGAELWTFPGQVGGGCGSGSAIGTTDTYLHFIPKVSGPETPVPQA
jgi:hypothetical protein